MMTNRVGIWSAAAVAGISVTYVVVLAAGMLRHGFHEPITDPILAVMEGLTLASALPIVTLIVALLDRARAAQRLAGTVAVVFAALFAGTTSAVHFVGLTAGRQAGGGLLVWPSTAYALELLAWDVFLGVALVAAAATVEGRGRAQAARRGLLVCGGLCLVGTVGPVVGNMRLQLVGVVGYAVVLPIVAVLLLRLFAAERRSVLPAV
jgi:uncharacterized membrane protein